MAYGVSASGSDWTEIRVRDIDGAKDLPDVIKWVKFSDPTWTKDSKGFFYARFPIPTGNENLAKVTDQKIYYHLLGEPEEKDRMIY